MKHRILIVDDEPSICQVLTYALNSVYEVSVASDADHVLGRLAEETIDLVLLDLQIGQKNGIDVLKAVKEKHPELPIIMMTAYGSIRSSVEAMREGAFTYLTKPLDIEELLIFIQNALRFHTLKEQVDHLSNELRSLNGVGYGGMVGKNAQMQKIYALIERLKNVDASVLITGESGCGKELVARAIHYMGKRQTQNFVALNCAAIPESLLEEELFGHKKGTFTGAVGARRGKLDLADNGTLFLDEVGDMSLPLQRKLLRVLQEREFSPLGDNEVYQVDLRVLAATNQNLREMMKNGSFRNDLFYRLNVVEIHLPPLRERRDDIPLLCEHFLRRAEKGGENPPQRIEAEAMRWLMEYDYPGNIRELANILEYATVVSNGATISCADLPSNLSGTGEPVADAIGASFEQRLIEMTLEELERAAVFACWEAYDGKQRVMAQSLGLSERGLRNKLYQYHLISKGQ